jgi:hypothetical protein
MTTLPTFVTVPQAEEYCRTLAIREERLRPKETVGSEQAAVVKVVAVK